MREVIGLPDFLPKGDLVIRAGGSKHIKIPPKCHDEFEKVLNELAADGNTPIMLKLVKVDKGINLEIRVLNTARL